MRAALMALGAFSTSRRVHPAADRVSCLRINRKCAAVCDLHPMLCGYATRQTVASLGHHCKCTVDHPACVVDALCDDLCESSPRCWPGRVGSLACADRSSGAASMPRDGPAELCAVL